MASWKVECMLHDLAAGKAETGQSMCNTSSTFSVASAHDVPLVMLQGLGSKCSRRCQHLTQAARIAPAPQKLLLAALPHALLCSSKSLPPRSCRWLRYEGPFRPCKIITIVFSMTFIGCLIISPCLHGTGCPRIEMVACTEWLCYLPALNSSSCCSPVKQPRTESIQVALDCGNG